MNAALEIPLIVKKSRASSKNKEQNPIRQQRDYMHVKRQVNHRNQKDGAEEKEPISWEGVKNLLDAAQEVQKASAGAEGHIPPKTVEQKLWQYIHKCLEFVVHKKTGKKLDLNDKEGGGLLDFDRTRNRDAPRRNAPVDTSTINALVVQDGIGGYDWSFQAKEGLTNFALMAYTSQGSSSSSSLDSKLEEALKEKDDLKLKLEKFEESSKNLTKLINSQISAKDKTGLGYDGQMNESELNNIHMNESEVVHSVFNSRESDVDDNLINDKFKTGVVAPIIEEWDTDNDNDSVFRLSDQTKPKFTKINFVKSSENVKSVNKENTHRKEFCFQQQLHNSQDSALMLVSKALQRAASFNSTVRLLILLPSNQGNPQYTLQDQGIFDSGCSRHMTRNKSFLTDYQEIDGGFVAFGGSPKGGKITRKGKINTGKLDFKDV
ncbi:hypothetical protein Tco_1564077 [Tanacetum coccineum]